MKIAVYFFTLHHFVAFNILYKCKNVLCENKARFYFVVICALFKNCDIHKIW